MQNRMCCGGMEAERERPDFRENAVHVVDVQGGQRYLEESPLQEEHLVCVGGGASEKTFHCPCLPESTLTTEKRSYKKQKKSFLKTIRGRSKKADAYSSSRVKPT